MLELFKLLGVIAIDNSDANKEIDNTTSKASGASSKIAGAFKAIGAAAVTYLSVSVIKEFGLACVTAAADANAAKSQFSQVFGTMEGDASKSLSKIADEAGIVETRMQGSFTKIAAFAKTSGMDTDAALSLSERAMRAVADSAAFYDRSLEDTTESLQSFLKGNYENDAALGLSATETTRNAAANDLYGKSFKDLSEAQKQLTLLKMVEDANKASGALGQAARESDTWTNVTGNLQQSWIDFKAVIGDKFLDTAVQVVKKMSNAVQSMTNFVKNAETHYNNFKLKIQEAQDWVQKHSTGLTYLGIAIGTVTTALLAYNSAAIIKKALDIAETVQIAAMIAADYAYAAASAVATAATTAFGAAVSFLTSPITLVILAIGALIAIGVALYKNWDTVKAKGQALWQSVKSSFNNLKQSVSSAVEGARQAAVNKFESMRNSISSKIESAKDKVKSAIDKMKSFFNFEWSLPHIKLPHFSISGKFSLNPPSIPHFSVDWYAKAMNNPMLMNSPTIFGYNARTGQFMGGGEAGSEVVSGTNTLMNMIQGAVGTQNGEVVIVLQLILEAIKAMDENMGGNLAEAIDGMGFKVNDREFGRLVRKAVT